MGATVNGAGALVMRAERVGAETVLARIVELVGEAQRSRAPIQRLADAAARVFVPAVVAVAALTFAIWAAFGPEPRFAYGLVAAVSVLIIACPCALGLATPMSIMVATGKGATLGVLFRDAEAIETLGKVDTLVVDKTGTLTEGRPELLSVVSLGALGEAGARAARREPRAGERAPARRGAGARRDDARPRRPSSPWASRPSRVAACAARSSGAPSRSATRAS